MAILNFFRSFKARLLRYLCPYNPLFLFKSTRVLGFPLSYRRIQNADDFILGISKRFPSSSGSLSLDLGCGKLPKNPFYAERITGVDIIDSSDGNIIMANLVAHPIPFPDSVADYITAYDFIEHVPRSILSPEGDVRFPFIHLINEVSRVLKPGGIFFSWTPAFPSKECFTDPTHVNYITENTFVDYFCSDDPLRRPKATIYGYTGTLCLVDQVWYKCWLLTVMVKKEHTST